jgi:hypothetical protein
MTVAYTLYTVARIHTHMLLLQMLASRTADSALFTQQVTRLQSQCDELQQKCTAAELRATASALDGVGAEVGRAVVAHVSSIN